MRFRSGWWLVSASLVLAGCGGGGSSTPPPTAPTVTAVTPSSGSTGIAISSTVTVTFSTAMSSSTITTSTFTLTAQGGGAVTGTVSYNSTGNSATFTPTNPLSSNTTYTATITTGAQSSTGTALGANYTWTFTTVAGQAPTVTAFTPGNTATGVSVDTTVTATFSEAMNASTITTSTFTLTAAGGTAVTGTVTYSSATNTATFTPGAALSYDTAYTATVTTGAMASDGTALASSNSWTFTTSGPPAPTVTSVTPASNATGVAVTSTVTATFSEALNTSTVTGSTFTLVPLGGTSVAATFAFNGDTVTLTPSSPLAYNTQYTATLTTGITGSNGVALAQNYPWSFTTATAPPPTVTAVTPTNAATGVAVTATLTATFSQVMSSSTITNSTFTLATQSGTPVAGAVSYNSTTSVATFAPSQDLAYNTMYTATISVGATSAAGIPLAQAYSWSFTTTTPPVPTVTSTVPASGATDVVAANALSATFSQPMNASTLTSSTFTLATTSGGTPVSGTVTYTSGTQTATFTPGAALAYSTSYTATVTTGAESAAGAALAANYSWNFTTGTAPNAATVDFGTTYQTIRGFGGSTAWLGQMPQAVATALFSPTNGLGLSILRVRIDPTGSASGGGANNDPYETGEWDYEAANGLEAVTANPNAVVFATPWTPPATWKLNGTSSTVDGTTFNEAFYDGACSPVAPLGESYCGGYLDPNHYADYASYLEDFVTFFNTTNNFNLYAISMQNEPEENVSYESCVWTPQQMDTWVANNASTITSDAYSTKLIMPESDDFNPVDASTTLSDSNAEGQVSIVGGHIYQVLFGGSIVPYTIPAGDTPKELWMTEFGPLSSTAPSWSEALTTYGEAIHNSMVTGQYNAFVWWGAFGYSTGNCATSAGTCGLVDNSGNVTVTGQVMGQYSKFIQPGFVRVSATATPVAGVYLSAYNYTGSKNYADHYVIVAINTNTTAENIAFTLNDDSNPDTSVTSLTPYESTSATSGIVPQTAVPVTDGQFTFALPAQSMVTFVQ
jgi:O-glycosyl hydrolase